MAEGVIADSMTRPHQLAHDVRPLSYETANDKKRRPHIMLGQNVQQTQRVRIIGAIVVCERQLLGPMAEPGEGAPVPLPRGRHSLVTSGRCCPGTRDSGQDIEHEGIVNRVQG